MTWAYDAISPLGEMAARQATVRLLEQKTLRAPKASASRAANPVIPAVPMTMERVLCAMRLQHASQGMEISCAGLVGMRAKTAAQIKVLDPADVSRGSGQTRMVP
jgi:hypothetical protein